MNIKLQLWRSYSLGNFIQKKTFCISVSAAKKKIISIDQIPTTVKTKICRCITIIRCHSCKDRLEFFFASQQTWFKAVAIRTKHFSLTLLVKEKYFVLSLQGYRWLSTNDKFLNSKVTFSLSWFLLLIIKRGVIKG